MLTHLFRWVLEAFGVALVARYILGRRNINDVARLTAIITAALIVLELFAPKVVNHARQGLGFGMGAQLTGGLLEGMDDPESLDYYQNDRLPAPSPLNLQGHQSPYAAAEPHQLGGGSGSHSGYTDIHTHFNGQILSQATELEPNDIYFKAEERLGQS